MKKKITCISFMLHPGQQHPNTMFFHRDNKEHKAYFEISQSSWNRFVSVQKYEDLVGYLGKNGILDLRYNFK